MIVRESYLYPLLYRAIPKPIYFHSNYLGTIEYSIARYFYENDRKIKDNDAVLALKNIRKNCGKNISFFKLDLEKEIVENLLELVEEEPITHHEFKLIIDYIFEINDSVKPSGSEYFTANIEPVKLPGSRRLYLT